MNLKIEFMLKATDFYPLQKARGKVWAASMDQSFLPVQKSQQQMHPKLLKKGCQKKQQK